MHYRSAPHLVLSRTAAYLTSLLVIASIAISLPEQAVAMDPAERTKKAQRHVDRGKELYRAHKYRAASEELRQAYALEPVPLLLYNIVLAEWRAGDWQQALETAAQVRTQSLPDKTRVKLDSRIAALGAMVQARSVAVQMKQREPTIDEPEPTLGTTGWVGTGLSTVGAGMLVGALVVDGQLEDDGADLEAAAHSADRAAYDRLLTDVQDRQTLGRVLAVGGAALAVTGAAMLVWDLTDDSAEADAQGGQLSLTPSGDGIRLGWSLTF